jgi:hypothetical protein
MNAMDEILRFSTPAMVAIIGYFVRQLITEHKRTREELIGVMRIQAVDNEKYKQLVDDIIQLRKSDEQINVKLVDVVERLVRIETDRPASAGKRRS